MRGLVVGAVVSALCCGYSTTAAADIFCVAPEGSCPAGKTFSTVQQALDAANNNGNSLDTVKLGAATYSDGPFTAGPADAVDIVGHGAGQTVLTISGNPTMETVLTVGDAQSMLSGLGITVPAGFNDIGAALAGSADSVSVDGPGADGAIGVSLTGSFRHGSVDLPFTGSFGSVGVSDNGGSVSDSTISAGRAISSASSGSTAERDKLSGNTGFEGGGTLEDSVLTVKDTGLYADATGSSNVSLTARHDTIIGDGSPDSVGAYSFANSRTSPVTATLTLDDSILHGFDIDLDRAGANAYNPPGCQAELMCVAESTANLIYGYDDYGGNVDHAHDTGGGGTPGSYTDSGHNLTVDPDFVASGANPPDYHLRFDSPLIDSGMPSIESGESSQDADSNPRAVDGNGDGATATDIGAYEYQHRPPTATLSVPAAQLGAGRGGSASETFTGSATDPDPGDAVALTWSFSDGGTATGPSVTHSFSHPGPNTVTLTAIDSTGLRDVVSAVVTLFVPGQGHPDILGPVSLNPHAFRAAHTGASIARRRTGTTITYTSTTTSATTFSVARVTSGSLRAGKCVAARRKSGHSKPRQKRVRHCRLLIPVRGSFTHSDAAGANRFHFTGRVGGSALTPGSYVLTAAPHFPSGRPGQRETAGFRIIR